MPPNNYVVIGDSLTGVEAAQRAHMRCIAVTITYPPEVLTRADVGLQDLNQLPLAEIEKLDD